MNLKPGYRLGGVAVALSLSLTVVGVAYAQDSGGVVLGEVDNCINGTETPAVGVSVGVDGGPASIAQTDENGQFVLNVGAGTYTVVATAKDGSIATRPYVPVEGGVAIDIGVLDLATGAGGCGNDAGIPAAALQPTVAPTVAPTLEPTPVPPTATPVPPPPTPTVEATPVPDDSGDSSG
jgi:hypothetical protein